MFKIQTSRKKCILCQANGTTFLLNAPGKDFVNVLCPNHLHEQLGEWEQEDAAERARKQREKELKKATEPK